MGFALSSTLNHVSAAKFFPVEALQKTTDINSFVVLKMAKDGITPLAKITKLQSVIIPSGISEQFPYSGYCLSEFLFDHSCMDEFTAQ
jgi:hypothetical protein